MSTANTSTRNFVSMQQKYDRVILLVDMDCFYCQVEEKLDPELKGKPVAVVQYNAWRGGGIIAVNYAARAKGVTRHMRGDEAKEQCPEIQLVKVPNVREKADLSKYREAGKEVANVLQKFTTLLERASVDEAYLDITETVNKRLNDMNAGTFTLKPQELVDTYAVGYERFGDYLKTITQHFANPYADDEFLNRFYEPDDIPAVRSSDVRLLLGASIASEIRASVKASTGYECSAGIAHNKIIAKLACGINKPNKQTILPLKQIEQLFETLPLGKIKGLGGKFGEDVCERLNIKTLGQMLKFTEAELQKKFDEKNGTWLYYISRGIDLEAVTPRFYSKSIGCCKKFPGRNNITGLQTLKHWLNELATEIAERLEKDIIENNRKAKQMTVSYIQENEGGDEVSSSRSVPLYSYDQETLAMRSVEIIKANTKQFFQAGSEAVLNNPIKFLGISVGKFESIDSGQTTLQTMFANQAMKKRKVQEETDEVDDKVVKVEVKPQVSEPPQGTLARLLQNHTKKTTKDDVEVDKVVKVEVKPQVSEPPQGTLARLLQNHTKRTTKDDVEVEKSNVTISTQPASKSPIKSFFMRALQGQVSVKQTSSMTDNDSIDVQNSSASSSLSTSTRESNSLNGLLADIEATSANVNGSNSNDSYGSPERKRFKSTMPAPVVGANANATLTADYQSQYAEYAAPELRLDLLEFQKCELCGVKIPKEERAQQTHRDHHFALELSQQMRAEFRTEIENNKNKINNKSNNKNNKKSSTQKAKPQLPPAANITKFLKQANSSTSKSPDSSAANETAISEIIDVDEAETTTKTTTIVEQPIGEQPTTSATTQSTACDKCKKLIPQTEWTEHLDYHLARELQIELNKQTMTRSTRPTTSPSPSIVATKSSQRIGSQRKAAAKSKAKPISKFFTQTPEAAVEDKS